MTRLRRTQNLPNIPDLPSGAAELNTGHAVLLEVTSRGGIQYEPAEVELKGTIKMKTQVQTVDDLELDRWVTQTRNAALNLVRKYAVHIEIGLWFATETAYEKIDHDLEVYRNEAMAINARARHIGSDRETRCEIWSFGWDPNDTKLALRMGQLIHSRMTSLKEAYTDKRKERYRVEKDRCRNLETLVLGEQSRLIRDAIHSADSQREIMIAHYGGVNFPTEWGSKIPPFDYHPIDTVIRYFAPLADLFLVQKAE